MGKLSKPVLIAVIAGAVLVAVGVGVLATLVGAAIYGYPKVVIAGNEAAALANVEAIRIAQIRYYTEHRTYCTFDQLIEQDFLSRRFAGDTPIVDGYVYNLRVAPARAGEASTFALNADPKSADMGRRHFFIDDSSGTIHVNSHQPASANDPPK